ncbi:MAG: rhamnulokinase [Ruminococcaceae bacterium]|nr:rhamnulokinase [Oscillospiraceae bacterium]
MKRILSFDFGASSGRAMLATLQNGKIQMEEIHRFSNDTVIVRGTMYWDILRLFFEIKTGITKAVNSGGFDAIGIDTWGVDFGLIDKNGNLLSNPVHYRDKRTEGVMEKVFETVSRDELYSMTGTQCLRINTLYQLMALKYNEPELLERTEKMLLIPDLFAYMLTGEMKAEASIVSTTNLFDPYKRDWNFELIEKLGLPENIFAPVIKPGSVYGYLTDDICEELGCEKVPVIAVATHDTASAVAATPSLSDDFVYISCGTWSLFGIENKTPILTAEAANANFTNEGGFDDTTRFLKNIMGLWLIQESRRQWRREGKELGFDILEKEALASEPFRCFIDVDDPLFETAGNLPKRVQQFCERTGQYVPQTIGEIMRCIYQSLAMKYKYTFNKLNELGGKKYNRINILGGGIKDKLLCQMTADACNVEVLAGPTEATVMGNIAVAYCALGEIDGFSGIRKAVTNSTELKHYTPTDNSAWENAYQEYIKIL